MEKFGSLCDGFQDQNVSESKSNKRCCPYYLICNCTCYQKTKYDCHAKHSIQPESMINFSPIDKLIIKNRKKIKSNGQHFSKKEKKTNQSKHLKNDTLFKKKNMLLTIKDKPQNIKCHKTNNNWNKCITERRSSRRLSNLPPDNIKLGTEEDLSSSYDLVLLGLVSKKCNSKIKKKNSNEIIKNTGSEDLQIEDNSRQVLTNSSLIQNRSPNEHKKSAVTDDVQLNEYQNKNSTSLKKKEIINPVSIFNKDTSNDVTLIPCHENTFLPTHASDKNSVIPENISNPVFDQNFNCDITKINDNTSTHTFLENKFSQTYNCDKTVNSYLQTNVLSVGKEVSEQTFDEEENLKLSNKKKEEASIIDQTTLQKIFFEEIETKKLPSLLNVEDCSKSNKSGVPSLLDKSLVIFKTDNTSSNKTFSKSIETKEIPPKKKSLSETIITEKMPSRSNPYFKMIETNKSLSPNKPISKINKSEAKLIIGKKCSEIIEKTITLSSPEIFVDTISKVSSTCEPYLKLSDINKTISPQKKISNTSALQNIISPLKPYSISTEIKKILTPDKPCLKITEIVNTENSLETISMIDVTEKASSPLEIYSKVVETENIKQFDAFSDPIVLKASSLPKTYSKQTLNMPKKYPQETLVDEHLLKSHSEIIIKDKPTFSDLNSQQTIEDKQVLPKKYSKIIKNNNLIEHKNYWQMTFEEKKLYRDKLNFMNYFGLLSMEQFQEIKNKNTNSTSSKNNSSCLKMLPDDNNAKMLQTCYPLTNTEKRKRSYFLDYSNRTNGIGNQISKPVLTSKDSSKSLFHLYPNCSDKCSLCNKIFDLLDTPHHVSQITDVKKKKRCLENLPYTIGPNSCLCNNCVQYIEKPNIEKMTCSVLNCKSAVVHEIKIPLNKFQNLLLQKGVIFKTWVNAVENIYICNAHRNQILDIIQCHLCGNRTIHKSKVDQSKVSTFQSILQEDQVPVTVKNNSFICKACLVYLLSQTRKNINNSYGQTKTIKKHREIVLKRICHYNKIKFPSCLEKKVDTQVKMIQRLVKIPFLPSTENNINTNCGTTFTVNKKLVACSVGSGKVSQKLKTTNIKKLNLKQVGNSNLTSSQLLTTTVSLKKNQISPILSIQNTDNNLPSPALAFKSKCIQTRKEKENIILTNNNSEILRQMHLIFYPNALNLIKHLISVEKTRLVGDLKFKDDDLKQPKISCGDVHTSLLHSSKMKISLNDSIKRNLLNENNDNNYKKMKTVTKIIPTDRPMKNIQQYNSPLPQVSVSATTSKNINFLSTINKNNISKNSMDISNKAKYGSSSKGAILSSTIMTTNFCREVSMILTDSNSTITTPITQKLEKIVPIKEINHLNHGKLFFINHNTGIYRNANISHNSSKFVKISSNIHPSRPSNMVSPITEAKTTSKNMGLLFSVPENNISYNSRNVLNDSSSKQIIVLSTVATTNINGRISTVFSNFSPSSVSSVPQKLNKVPPKKSILMKEANLYNNRKLFSINQKNKVLTSSNNSFKKLTKCVKIAPNICPSVSSNMIVPVSIKTTILKNMNPSSIVIKNNDSKISRNVINKFKYNKGGKKFIILPTVITTNTMTPTKIYREVLTVTSTTKTATATYSPQKFIKIVPTKEITMENINLNRNGKVFFINQNKINRNANTSQN